MELRVRDASGVIDTNFGNWLISFIRTKLISNIRKYPALVNWDNYLTESTEIKRLYNRDYTTDDIIVFAADNIVCTGTMGDVSIKFNNNKFVPGYDRLKLDTIVKTINYGTLDTKACPIFKDTLNYFAKDIDSYISLYYGI